MASRATLERQILAAPVPVQQDADILAAAARLAGEDMCSIADLSSAEVRAILKLGSDHEALAANVDDGAVASGEDAKLLLEVVADFGCVGEEIGLLDVIDDCNGNSASQRASTKGGAMHAGVDGARDFFSAEDRTEGNAAGEGLG